VKIEDHNIAYIQLRAAGTNQGDLLWRLGNVHTGLELKAEGLRNQTEKTGRTKLRVLGGEDQLTS
jgi:hypothetical protein